MFCACLLQKKLVCAIIELEYINCIAENRKRTEGQAMF